MPGLCWQSRTEPGSVLVATPANDYYGGHRPGDNLFGESLVCLNAATGERVWHYQLVHHGLWDFDLPAAPNLVDIRVDGQRVKAVAQVTKQGFCFVFNRVTGKPIWPIEEKVVPPSDVPGERASPTQPFPTRPAPFERQGLGEDDLIDFTPELRAEAKAVIARYRTGPLFTPPTEKGTISLPSVTGGANWAGAAYDSDSGYLYVPSATLPFTITLTKPPSEDSEATRTSPARYVGKFDLVALSARGLLLTKPPYGRVTAIDLNTGDHAWMKPLGEGPRHHPDLSHLNLPRLGWPFRGHILLTKSLLLVAQEGRNANLRPSDRRNSIVADFNTFQPKLAAFDKATGELIAEVDLPANAAGAPMTYMMGGKQYIAMPVGGGNLPAELIALALPVKDGD